MKKYTLNYAAAALAGLGLVACASVTDTVEVTTGTVIRNATVVNTRDGSLTPGMTIIIHGGKIEQVAAIASIHISGSARLVDASGKYLVPGYLDMHTHAMPMADKQPGYWPLLIANGITGIREMAGSAEFIARTKTLNADSAAGRVDAPEILLMPGNLLVGVMSPALGVQQVQQQKAMGADFIKLVSANHEATVAILAEAKKQGLSVAGHLPPSVSAEEASKAGWHAIEHLGAGMGLLLDCATDEVGIRNAALRAAGPPVFTPDSITSPMLYRYRDAPFYQQILNNYSEEKCLGLAATFIANDTWQVPTLVRLRAMEFSNDPRYRNDPNLVYVSKTSRALWEQLAAQFEAKAPAAAANTFQQYYVQQQKVIGLMKQHGVKMLTGSDLGGIWVIPGFGLHREFRELASAGLSPLDILQMTTLNGAEFLHRETSMGTVEAGKNADLVLLDANPIADVANLDRISGVFLKGKYFSKEDLETMKSKVAQAYAQQPIGRAGAEPVHID